MGCSDNFGNGVSRPSIPPGFVKKAWLSTVAESSAVPTCRTRRNATWTALGLGVEDLFHHVLAVLHDPSYREANAGALRMEWPRIPLPGWPDGDAPGAAEEVAASAARGRELAALLDSETPVPSVTTGRAAAGDGRDRRALNHGRRQHGRRRLLGDGRLGALRAGGGRHAGPRQSRRAPHTQRRSAPRWATRQTPSAAPPSTSTSTTRAYWRNVPAAVWSYKLGGYQVLKKWLSYRERGVLGRALRPEEVQHFTDTARRIAGILGLVGEG